ncbi:MAG: RHS repeat-associated core domain-containing protein, partial [Planctomycetota bacterium]
DAGEPNAQPPVPPALVERYDYDPYGRTYVEDGAGVRRPGADSQYGNPFMWTGQRCDAAERLYHFLFRTYSPELGRWLQRDPLGHAGGINMYEYVASRPTAFTDPLGLMHAGGFGAGSELDIPGGDTTTAEPPNSDGPTQGPCSGWGQGLGGYATLPPVDWERIADWIWDVLFGPKSWAFGTRYARQNGGWGFFNGGTFWPWWNNLFRLGWTWYQPPRQAGQLLFGLHGNWPSHWHYYVNHLPWGQPAAYGGLTVGVTAYVLGVGTQVVVVVFVAATHFEAGRLLGEQIFDDEFGEAVYGAYVWVVDTSVQEKLDSIGEKLPAPGYKTEPRDCRYGCHGGFDQHSQPASDPIPPRRDQRVVPELEVDPP